MPTASPSETLSGIALPRGLEPRVASKDVAWIILRTWPGRLGLRFSCVLILVAGLTLVAHRSLGRPAIGIDDANIFFVYARNLAQGDGFVYSVGGERVEGFTSLLWVLVCAAGYRLTPHPEPWLLGLNVVLVSAALTALATFVEERIDPWLLGTGSAAEPARLPLLSVTQVALLAWTFASPAFVVHTTLTLMDTGLWTCAFVAGALLALGDAPSRGRLTLAVGLVVLTLTRPEGMLWAPVFLVGAWLRKAMLGGDPRRAARDLALPAAAFAVALAALTLFRIAYFGQPLPNTYYAKVGPNLAYRLSQGFNAYLREFVRSNAFIAVFTLASLALLLDHIGPLRAAARRLRAPAPRAQEPSEAATIDGCLWSALVLLGLFVPVYLGGDHFGAFRFYQPLWPVLALPPLYLLVALRRRAGVTSNRSGLGRFKALFALAMVVLFHSASGSGWLAVPRRTGLAHEFRLAEAGQETGRALAAIFGRERPSVGVYAAGGIALTYPGRVLDLLGLNLREMATAPGDRLGIPGHAGFNRAVFYRLQPDVVFPEIDGGAELDSPADPFATQIVDGLFSEQRFAERYVRATVRSGTPGLQELGIVGWFRRGFLERLPALGLVVRRLDDRIASPPG